MHWMLIAAIIVAGVLSSLTDWFFMGVLFHDRYNKYPDTWWLRGGSQDAERSPILWSTALGFVTAAAVVLLCVFAGVTSITGGLIVAALAAAAGPLVTTITNGMWIRIDPAVTAAHTLGYIVRFLIAGIAAGFALS
jgi:Mg/Co/Ni transporter MgtE